MTLRQAVMCDRTSGYAVLEHDDSQQLFSRNGWLVDCPNCSGHGCDYCDFEGHKHETIP